MNSEYCKEIGFLCGLEIHQRLDTERKLFCSCSSKVEEDRGIGSVFRFQRAVSGERGLTDVSAEFEETKNRKFVYALESAHSCLVDIDEEPPHELDAGALRSALALARSLGMKIFNELQIMRKVIVDGSNPGAFQRTIMVGDSGMLDMGSFKINIPSMFLEEESSGIISSSAESIIYDTSRLGIPLIEIDTDFHIPTPQDVKEVALRIGKLLRISGFSQRGIGSIRQDVNVSIRGGARVEIKGFQDIGNMDKFIENEILRQQNILKINNMIKNARASLSEPKDITHIFAEAKSPLINFQLSRKGIVIGMRLANFKGVLGTEVNSERRFGTEVSDYAKIGGVNGIIHGDEGIDKYGFSEVEARAIRDELGIDGNDSFIIVAGMKRNCENAIRFARMRLEYALSGRIPEETRGVSNADLFTTKFLRPVPGSARMYPETDLRTVRITQAMLEDADANAPCIEKEEESLKAQIKSSGLREQMMMSPRYGLYKLAVSSTDISPEVVANVLVQKFTELRRAGYYVEKIPEEKIVEIFRLYADSKITKQAIDELLKESSKTNESISQIVLRKSLMKLDAPRLAELVQNAMRSANTKDRAKIIAAVMSANRLNIDGDELNKLLDRLLS
ncbi:Glu-tRNA(Gln) amidotransferase subunit GatE [Candidatus Marsarchaeota archaeon]|nr:Glu-tRNA(Gln) amidotransferase subunit GatE [Candidatus Marsarchaeota archaeon]